MCGILFSNSEKLTDAVFYSALCELNHRGPDSSGARRFGRVRLGHTRLKVIDLSDRSGQPIYSRSGKTVMVFNGEIYNFKDLLKKYAVPFASDFGDSEALVELFELEGTDIFRELDGMFAAVFFIIDANRWVAVRDRRGVKPLYMYREGEAFSFSSELKPLVILHKRATVDEFSARQFLQMRGTFGNRTIFKEYTFVPPGAFIDNGSCKTYWRAPFECEDSPPTIEELDSLVSQSVRTRLLSDVSVGSFLSGGLDSSLITALSKVKYSYVVGAEGENEFEWSRAVASELNTSHTEVTFDAAKFKDIARAMVHRRFEPLAIPNEVLIFELSRHIKLKTTVVLSGEGADELFLGYDRIFRWALSTGNFDVAHFANLYCYGRVVDIEPIEEALDKYMHLGKPIDIVMAFFREAHLHGLLRRLDFSTMQSAVEARVPFVDSNVLNDRLLSVRPSFFIHKNEAKYPLKKVAERYLPQQIVYRPKVGFPVPLEKIFHDRPKDKSPYEAWLDFNLATLREIV